MHGGRGIQMRKYTEQDKEEAFTLYAQSWSYGDIAKEMNKRYKGYKLNKSTVLRWSTKGEWDKRKDEVMDKVRNVTQRKATTSITRAIKLGSKLQSSFNTQLEEGMELRPSDAYAWTRWLVQLETAVEARDVLIEEVAQLSAEAMDKAGIPKQKQAAFAQYYTQLVRDLKGKSND